jgi:hypothetical protein
MLEPFEAGRAAAESGQLNLPNLDVNHWNRLQLAFRAGTGSACFMIIYYAFLDFGNKPWQVRIESLIGIFLAFIIIITFLYPLVEAIRKLLHMAPEEVLHRKKGFLPVLAASIVSATGIFQDVLQEKIMSNPVGAGTLLLTVFVFAGSITYSWTVGLRRRIFRAKWLGAFCGFILGALVILLICQLFPEQGFCQLSLEEFIGGIIANGLIWGLLGFAGGLAVDLGWGSRPLIIVLFLLTASLISNLPLFYMQYIQDPDLPSIANLLGWRTIMPRVFLDIVKVLGWGFGLLVDPNARTLLTDSRDLPK